MTRRKKICGAGSAAEGIPAPPQPHREPRRINQHRDTEAGAGCAPAAEEVPAQRGLVPSVPGSQPFPPGPIPRAPQQEHTRAAAPYPPLGEGQWRVDGKIRQPGCSGGGTGLGQRQPRLVDGRAGPLGTGDGADVTLWMWRWHSSEMWERGEDVQGRGAAGMQWRQGCPSLLQHLWNLPGTLCRYNAGSQPSSCEDWGLPEAFQLPTGDTGDGTWDGARSHPSPGTKKRWGHGELAK